MINLIFLILLPILLFLLLLPMFFAMLVNFITRIFRVPRRTDKAKRTNSRENVAEWQYTETSAPTAKNKKIFSKDEGEYVSFKDVEIDDTKK